MLRPLQIGPTEFMADRFFRVSMPDLAIGEWSRIATIHSDRYYRASQALAAIRDVMVRDNRNAEAEKITAWIDELKNASAR